MTTKFIETNPIDLYKIGDDRYVKMMDVLKMIHHEFFETESKEFRTILDRMEMRLTKNDFSFPKAKKPIEIKAEPPKEEKLDYPGRYAIGREVNGEWIFYVDTKDGETTFSNKPCRAKLYKSYRSACAVADFIDDNHWDILDWIDNMSEEERWIRDLRMPCPFDDDEGNEESIPVQVVT